MPRSTPPPRPGPPSVAPAPQILLADHLVPRPPGSPAPSSFPLFVLLPSSLFLLPPSFHSALLYTPSRGSLHLRALLGEHRARVGARRRPLDCTHPRSLGDHRARLPRRQSRRQLALGPSRSPGHRWLAVPRRRQ